MILIQITDNHKKGNYTFSIGKFEYNTLFPDETRFWHKIGQYNGMTTHESLSHLLKEL